MSTKLPMWARKPKNNKVVVATSRGWELEETGELLVSVRNLDQKLKELYSTPTALLEQTTETVQFVPSPVEGIVAIEGDEVKEPALVIEEPVIVTKEDSNGEEVVETNTTLKVEEPVKEESAKEEKVITPEPSEKVEEFSEEVKEEQVKKKPGRPKKVKVEEEKQ